MNTLYPIFLKPSKLKLLIIGGGHVGYNKLSLICRNSPDMEVEVVAKNFCDDIFDFVNSNSNRIFLRKKRIEKKDLIEKELVIAATNNKKLNSIIASWANEINILVNVADTPDLCDFYLGSIVTKGDLKIAISTDGKSPTFAKRFKEVLDSILPESTNSLINNLNKIRNDLKVDFTQKVDRLNEITGSLLKNR